MLTKQQIVDSKSFRTFIYLSILTNSNLKYIYFEIILFIYLFICILFLFYYFQLLQTIKRLIVMHIYLN